MKTKIKLFYTASIILSLNQLNAQLKPISAGASTPCVVGTTAWSLGGNTLPNTICSTCPVPANDAGTCNFYPFILKANNLQSIFIMPSGFIGVGANNSNPLAALDIRSSASIGTQSNFRIHGDFNGNLESTSHLNVNYAIGTDFKINEGPIFTGIGTYAGTNRMKIYANTGYVLFGDLNPSTISSRMHVTNNLNANAGSAYGQHCGILAEQIVIQGSSHQAVVGVKGVVRQNTPLLVGGIGVEGNASLASGTSIGVRGRARGGSYSAGVDGQGWCNSGQGWPNPAQSIGLNGEAFAVGNSDAFGVQAIVTPVTGGTGNVFAGLFWGNTVVTGNLTVQGVINPSDRKFKDEIQPLTGALDKVMQLKPSTYIYRTNEPEFKDMIFPQGKQMGLIAQELEKVIPESVKNMNAVQRTNSKGEITNATPNYMGVNYISLIPLLISGMQEQQKQIEVQSKTNSELKVLVEKQQQQINNLLLKSTGVTGINPVSNNVSSFDFSMDQNIPNPFSGETVIKYSLPQSVNKAFLAIYDLSGKQISTFPINDKASTSVTITSEKLAAGIYIYSIIADGKILDSKRMVVSEK
jgi:hypothetical protein